MGKATDTNALPPPDPGAVEHSAVVLAHIRAAIEDSAGWLPFARYMAEVLYAPGLGYYSAGAAKFGRAGDFVTAPEVSPLFGRCLAHQCAQVLAHTDGGEVLELGAGSGVLAADLLTEFAALQCLPERYRILEVSAELRQRQQATLAARVPQLLDRVSWLDRLPQGLRGVILGNEVVDALPVERFRIGPDGPQALGVGWADGLHWQEGPMWSEFGCQLAALQSRLATVLPDGYVSEINLGLTGWVAAIAASLAQGVLLFTRLRLSARRVLFAIAW